MTDWTKPESYSAKTIAWHAMKERLRGEPITGIWLDEAGNLTEEMIRSLIPPRFSLGDGAVIEPKGVRPPRIRAEFGGRRSGKTARIMGFDLASGPDKSVRAQWINGRLWLM